MAFGFERIEKMFAEKLLVEDYLIEKLEEKGWKFVSASSLERESMDEPLLIPNLVRALKRINRKSSIGDEEIKKVLNIHKSLKLILSCLNTSFHSICKD